MVLGCALRSLRIEELVILGSALLGGVGEGIVIKCPAKAIPGVFDG